MTRHGDQLWLATSAHYECQTIPRGLVRFDWADGSAADYVGTDDGPCGFAINGVAVWQGSLWAATDLGLSHMDLVSQRWQHLALTRDRLGLVPASCEDMITNLLAAAASPQPNVHVEQCSLAVLAGSFRPRLMEGLLRRKPQGDWGCADVRFLASRASDVEAVRQLSRNRDMRECAVAGHGLTGRRDSAWRDWLLVVHAEGSAAARRELARFRGDPIVAAHFTARLRAGRFVQGEPDRLVDVQGAKALPALMEAFAALPLTPPSSPGGKADLECFRDSSLLAAIERAAHRIISLDGSVVPLPSDSDQPTWEETRPSDLESRRIGWRWCAIDVHEKRALRRRWLTWWRTQRP